MTITGADISHPVHFINDWTESSRLIKGKFSNFKFKVSEIVLLVYINSRQFRKLEHERVVCKGLKDGKKSWHMKEVVCEG